MSFLSVTRVRTHLLMIGDELLSGDVVDRNKAWLGNRCRALGVTVIRATTVRDREPEIIAAILAAAADSELCLVTGGLGPTTDDLTAECVAKAAGVGMIRDPELTARLEAFFAARGRALIESNLKQADLPAGSTVLDNPIGTAAGFALDIPRPATAGGGSCWLASMPGVPREMQQMMRDQVEPRVRERFAVATVPRRIYRSIGAGESAVQHTVQGVIARAQAASPGLARAYVHYRARYPEVQLILEATPGDADEPGATAEELATLDDDLRAAIGPALYDISTGERDELPNELADKLVRTLIDRGLTLASAESCTGGGIGVAVTEIPGSSVCFLGGVIAYANAVKIAQLGVPAEVIDAHGAVSEQVARAMAEGVRTRLGADIGVSTTGIAGPGGATPDKPVGTVDVAVATASGTVYKRLKLFGNRDTIRHGATQWVLKLVLDSLA